MSGIAGFIRDERDQGGAPAHLDRMGETLVEGPNLLLSPPYCDHHVCCLSASLHLKESQVNINSDLAVWLDGEIYDFGTFADKIDLSQNPSTIIAGLYRRHGLHFLRAIDGIFAAVIYDRLQMELHIINDRYGLRRLYIWKGLRPVWASTLKCFPHAPGFAPRIDPAAVDDFVDLGYMTEERTWFKDVMLLASGSIFTWDMRAKSGKQKRYWWWNEIKLLGDRFDEDEVAEELSNRFVRAVKRRVRHGERVGLQLSGGLDSRAILAAWPEYGDDINTITFGRDGCPDRVIAARVAGERRAVNFQFPLDEKAWLLPRFAGVWLTDGQFDLMHMHGVEAAPIMGGLFDIALNGFLGDVVLGGNRIFQDALDSPITAELAARLTGQKAEKIEISPQYSSLSKTDFFFLQNKGRRFTYAGATIESNYIETRMPFYDNDLLEFTYSLPDILRLEGRIYKRMLLRAFPEYFRHIPWQKTGYPIGMSATVMKALDVTRTSRRKLSRISRGLFRDPFPEDFQNYQEWVRREPARAVFTALFNNQQAIYPNYLSRTLVQSAWNEHLRGMDHTNRICRYATFEIWLQQFFRKKLKTEADVSREFSLKS